MTDSYFSPCQIGCENFYRFGEIKNTFFCSIENYTINLDLAPGLCKKECTLFNRFLITLIVIAVCGSSIEVTTIDLIRKCFILI